MKLVALALALAFPAVAAAAETEPPARPRWSIGAGGGGYVFGNDVLVSSLSPASSSIPFVRASLERRVGEATWLVLGVAGWYSTFDADPPTTSGAYLLTDSDATEWNGRVEGGLRRELTGAGAPLVVSGLLLANVGGISRERRFLSGTPAEEVREDADAVVAGLSAGIAVDRELTRGLSVRISSSLVTASGSWSEIRTRGQPSRDARTFSVGLALAPILELRLAF
jgi:hypothetical protein